MSESFDDQPDLLRRSLVAGGVVAALSAAGVGGYFALDAAEKKRDAAARAAECERFDALVEAEKPRLREEIAGRITDQRNYHDLRHESFELFRQSGQARESGNMDEYERLSNESAAISMRIESDRGPVVIALLPQATPYAEILGRNERALDALATVAALYRAAAGNGQALPYWHNLAPGYLELAELRREEIIARFSRFAAKLDQEGPSIETLNPEDVLYPLLDPEFNCEFSPEAAEALLNRERPDWKEFPATHNNKACYVHYNEPSALTLHERNKLKAVVRQLGNPEFVASVFSARDADLADTISEHGGVIPRPEKEHVLDVIPTAKTEGNEAYMVPNEAGMWALISPAAFHFHAVTLEEPSYYQGPSGGDHGFYAPGVVFSSVNEDTILVHFFGSRVNPDDPYSGNIQQEVVCLGEIRRPRS